MNLHFHDHAFTRLKQSCVLEARTTSAAREIRSRLENDFALNGITEIEDATEPYRPSSSPDLPAFAERLVCWLSRVARDVRGWFRRPDFAACRAVYLRELHDIFYEEELDDNGNPCGPTRLVNKFGEEVDNLGGRVDRDSLGRLV